MSKSSARTPYHPENFVPVPFWIRAAKWSKDPPMYVQLFSALGVWHAPGVRAPNPLDLLCSSQFKPRALHGNSTPLCIPYVLHKELLAVPRREDSVGTDGFYLQSWVTKTLKGNFLLKTMNPTVRQLLSLAGGQTCDGVVRKDELMLQAGEKSQNANHHNVTIRRLRNNQNLSPEISQVQLAHWVFDDGVSEQKRCNPDGRNMLLCSKILVAKRLRQKITAFIQFERTMGVEVTLNVKFPAVSTSPRNLSRHKWLLVSGHIVVRDDWLLPSSTSQCQRRPPSSTKPEPSNVAGIGRLGPLWVRFCKRRCARILKLLQDEWLVLFASPTMCTWDVCPDANKTVRSVWTETNATDARARKLKTFLARSRFAQGACSISVQWIASSVQTGVPKTDPPGKIACI